MLSLCVSSTDPMYNLALEEWLFTQLTPESAGIFLLWHNAPSIIVGRHQNTVQEINQDLVSKYALPVVRRMTGGGAVYHDLGNVNFSFLRPLQKGEHSGIDFGVFLQPMVEALQSFGVDAAFSSRNDITVGQHKISGSAQLRRAGKVLHHGTLLVDLDLDMLGAVLTGAPDKYLSKGIASVRSRVTNVRQVLEAQGKSMSMEAIKESLIQRIAPTPMSLDAQSHAAIQSLMHEKYATHAWNYGSSPAFTEKRRHRFSWGLVECHFAVRKGIIQQVKIFGDFFAQQAVEELETQLCGHAYTSEALANALAQTPLEQYFSGCNRQEALDFFTNFT